MTTPRPVLTEEKEQIEATRAPLLEHFAEFRRRVLICLAALAVSFGLCYFWSAEIYQFLLHPLAEVMPPGEGRRLIYTSLPEAFFTYMSLSFYTGLMFAFPVISWQLYSFIAPGLYRRERHVLFPYLLIAPALFFLGAWLVYDFIMPLAWSFFLSFENPAGEDSLPIVLEARVSEYLAIVIQMMLAFGLTFQLPIVLTLLARVGMLQTATLQKGRKYAIVIIVTAAAILTPPDVISQIGLSVPLYLLYELSILSCRMMERRHLANLQAEEATNS
jgi:sec-independent protein translocase protein TatC